MANHDGNLRPFSDLRDSGLLWLINRVVFHPRGFALALVMHDGQPTGWKLLGDGTEVWRFEGGEDDRLAQVESTLRAAAGIGPDADSPLADWERDLLVRQAREQNVGDI